MPVFAAVDIGSNSVRLNVAEVTSGAPPRLLATDRDVARLGESVFRTGAVSDDAIGLLCGILKRMAALCARFRISSARAVATSALREAGNQAEFVARGSVALGMPVEIISGEEEARLIHLGVRSQFPCPGQRCLIIDVGGGSMEVILSEQRGVLQAWSMPLGAIRLQERFLSTDPPATAELRALEAFIVEQTATAIGALAGIPVSHAIGAIGTSATARAVVSAAKPPTTEGIRRFYLSIRALDLAGRQRVPGIGPQRAEIIIPGTAVLLHVLEGLGLPGIAYSPAGVRDGIIADLSAFGT
jgi:exopolyphosphatase/guanosine-5'-triphosphate,3'-diphosphate pyrophosphatase